MRKVYVWLALAAVAVFAVGAQASTTMWLSQDPVNGTPITSDVQAASGSSIPLYCFIESTDIGNTFEVMAGYDRSDALTYGAGKDSNNGDLHKLVLMSSASDISGSMDALSFDVLRSAVLDASGREEYNTVLGGRPYGFIARGATRNNAAPGKKMAFAFTLRNDMTSAGDSQYVVVSNNSGSKSFSSAWKYGTALYESSNVIKIVNTEGSSKSTVGATNKAVFDLIMDDAAGKYVWVLWGKVSNRTASGFDLDDGSGAVITVIASGNTVADGDYVSVKGALVVNRNARTAVLSSQSVKKHN